jgi:hypothetical protein
MMKRTYHDLETHKNTEGAEGGRHERVIWDRRLG